MSEPASHSGVLPIARGRSGALARAAVDVLSTKVLEPHLGQAMSPDAKSELAELMAAAIDGANPGRGSLAWTLVGALSLALVVTGGVFTWGKIDAVTTRQDAVDQRLGEGDHYAQTLAHYLMVKSNNDHSNAVSSDQLLRALARNAGVDTGHIPTPIQSPPPASVQRKDAEHREGQGE
jgi:hypothetical protein